MKQRIPYYDAPMMDEAYHDNWATATADGHPPSEPFYRAPLYPYFLSMIYKIFGHKYYHARLASVIIGSLSCLILFFIALEVFNFRVACLSGLLMATYPVLVYFDSQLLTTSLEIFLNLFAVFIVLNAFETPKRSTVWFFAGLFFGLAAITRPTILAFVGLIIIWVFFKHTKKLFPLLFGLIIVILPVTLRNINIGKDKVLIAWNGGINFYIGNNEKSNGWSATAPGIRRDWWGGYKDAIKIAEQESKKKLRPSQVSNYWFQKSVYFIKNKPLSFLKLLFKKFLLFFNSYELKNNNDYNYFKKYMNTLRFLLLSFGLIAPLGIIGFFLYGWKSFKTRILTIFTITYSLSIIAFFVCCRYRLPVIPILIIFTSASIFWFIDHVKYISIKKIVLFIICLMILCLLINLPHLGIKRGNLSQEHFNLGLTWARKHNWQKAITEYSLSIKQDPSSAMAHNNLGYAYEQIGDYIKARQMYQRALKLAPRSEMIKENLKIIEQKLKKTIK
jgi:tetratricopeptide (TPR) repeat protein